MGKPVDMWVIYVNDSDHPGKYVVRRWELVPPGIEPSNPMKKTADYTVCDTLVQAHKAIPDWASSLVPSLYDEPQAVEIWL